MDVFRVAPDGDPFGIAGSLFTSSEILQFVLLEPEEFIAGPKPLSFVHRSTGKELCAASKLPGSQAAAL